MSEDPAALRDDAVALQRAADVIRRRSAKPNAIVTQAIIRSLEKSAASMRNRADADSGS